MPHQVRVLTASTALLQTNGEAGWKSKRRVALEE
ncbi:hypothetical protein L917_08945 [Phytophthora nicotianae]|uniref:Uncharacterized protein n=1 Tax=Phytophthora nicotianae TaxID=4792 RepID=W2L5U9_PHYNI|nr:hypothetical protein L917_08945 [Phytophthora nicotianae]